MLVPVPFYFINFEFSRDVTNLGKIFQKIVYNYSDAENEAYAKNRDEKSISWTIPYPTPTHPVVITVLANLDPVEVELELEHELVVHIAVRELREGVRILDTNE